MWPQGRGGEAHLTLVTELIEPGNGPGQTDGWRSRSPGDHLAQGAQGQLHQSYLRCGWSRPRLRGWCKGKAAKQEGGDTDVWWLGHLDLWKRVGGWGGGLAATRQLAACLINATSANVAHPFDDIMVAVVQLRFKHLQVAHLEARGCEWHLKVHGNGGSSPLLLVIGGQ